MTTFENIAAQIAAGTITADEIKAYVCSSLSSEEKTALLTALATKTVQDSVQPTLASVQSGIFSGPGDLVVADFLSGRIEVVDTNSTATPDLEAPHQSVVDTVGDEYPEESSMEWPTNANKYYPQRTFEVPAGIKLLYTFILKD